MHARVDIVAVHTSRRSVAGWCWASTGPRCATCRPQQQEGKGRALSDSRLWVLQGGGKTQALVITFPSTRRDNSTLPVRMPGAAAAALPTCKKPCPIVHSSYTVRFGGLPPANMLSHVMPRRLRIAAGAAAAARQRGRRRRPQESHGRRRLRAHTAAGARRQWTREAPAASPPRPPAHERAAWDPGRRAAGSAAQHLGASRAAHQRA